MYPEAERGIVEALSIHRNQFRRTTRTFAWT
jgi:hypothetical protein